MMNAVVRTREETILRDIEIPNPEKGEVLVKVKSAGICGTDIAIHKGSFEVPIPIVMGHEFSGKVVRGNDEWVGTRVTSEINITCGKCQFCREGKTNHCLNRKALGIDIDGCFAEYIKVPEKNLHKIPFSYEKGTFVEPLAAAIQTTKKTKIQNGENVLILGCGRLGLLVMQVVDLLDANVYAADRDEDKLELATDFGAKPVILSNDDLPQFDTIVESTGNPNALKKAIKLVKPTGTIALKSTPGIPFEIDISQIPRKEITIQGSRCGPFDEAIELLKKDKINVGKMVSNKYRLKNFREAMKTSGVKNLFSIRK